MTDLIIKMVILFLLLTIPPKVLLFIFGGLAYLILTKEEKIWREQ